jgi:hypothetical protein
LPLNILNSELKRLNKMDNIILKASTERETNPMKLKIEKYLNIIDTMDLLENHESEIFDENNNTDKNVLVKSMSSKSLIENEKYKNISLRFYFRLKVNLI